MHPDSLHRTAQTPQAAYMKRPAPCVRASWLNASPRGGSFSLIWISSAYRGRVVRLARRPRRHPVGTGFISDHLSVHVELRTEITRGGEHRDGCANKGTGLERNRHEDPDSAAQRGDCSVACCRVQRWGGAVCDGSYCGVARALSG